MSLRIHYTADADKDSSTSKGKTWMERELQGVPRGIQSSQWQGEMKISWDATGGELVLPQLSVYRDKVVVSPFEVGEDGMRLFGAFDYGHRNPSSFHVHGIDFDGDIWTIWEYCKSGAGHREIARAIRACSRISIASRSNPSQTPRFST